MVKTIGGGGSDLSPDMQKIADKLKQLLKDGKSLNISIDELKKKAGVFNVKNATVSAYIARNKDKFKKLTIKKFGGATEVGTSKYDADYKNNKKFKTFYNEVYDTPWNEASSTNKVNSYKSFINDKTKLKKPGFNLTGDQIAKKFGITYNTLKSYLTPGKEKLDSTTSKFLRDNIEKIRTTVNRKQGVYFKDPSEAVMAKWNVIQDSGKISSQMADNIKEYNKVFRDVIIKDKRLPDLKEVFEKTSMKTPATVANTEALYSRILRGENFRRKIDIPVNVNAGARLIDLLASSEGFNSRRSAFYRLALDNVNKTFPNKSGNLETFKNNFRDELKKILGKENLKKFNKGQVPFSVNEIISLSAGESRGIQQFSVFVDAVANNINKKELSTYQVAFSKKVKKVQDALSARNPNIAKAEEIALSLASDRKTLMDKLTKQGYTTSQMKSLNLPEIKIGGDATQTYKAADLARYKKQSSGALDIGQFAKDKGYYIDVKKGKPFWESTIKNDIVTLAKNNTGNICNIFKGKVAFSADGGRIGFAGGCAGEMVESLEADSKGTLQKINKTDGVLGSAKNVATRFLTGFKNTGSFKTKIALGAGAVIGGGGAAALVRQFRSDDKSTYLTNDRQMEGMIIADDIERDLEDMGFILDNEGKIELAATGALSASMVKQVYNAARAGEAQLLEMPTELDQEARALRKTIDEIIRTPLSKKQLARKAFLKNNLKAYLEIQKNYPKQYDDLQRRAMDDKIKMTQDELKRLVPKKVKRITESGQQVIRESRDRLNQIENLAKDTKLRGTTGDLVNPGKSGRLMSALGLRKGVLGLGLNAFMSPAIALPTAAMSLARDIKSGKSTEDTLTNPFTYLPTAFMKSGMKGLAKMGATRGLMGVAGLGLGSVAAAPVVGALSIAGGLATLGSMGYQGYKMFKDRNKTDEDFFN